MKKVLVSTAVVIVGLVVLGASTHAAAGPLPHEGLDCLACSLCSWLDAVVQHL